MSTRHSLRGLPPDLLAEVRDRATTHGWPLTRTVIHLLQVGLRLDPVLAGKAGSEALTAEQRSARARTAAAARWHPVE